MKTCEFCDRPLREFQFDCECILKRIIKREAGKNGYGIFTYVEGCALPFPGNPMAEASKANDIVKRSIIAFLKHIPRFLFVFSPILLIKPLRLKIERALLNYFEELCETAFKKYYPQDSNVLCKSGRRLGGALLCAYTKEWIKKGIQMMWEFDVSYRFRGQDILSSLDKGNLHKNPKKEILRLLDLLISRERCTSSHEQTFDVLKKWKMIRKFAYFALFFKEIEKCIYDILIWVNVKDMDFSENDWYWVCERYDYDYRGIPFEERARQRIEIDKNYKSDIYLATM